MSRDTAHGMHGHWATNHFVMSATGPIGPGLLYHYFLFKGHTGNIGGDAFDGLLWNADLRGHHLWAIIRMQVSLNENLKRASPSGAGQHHLSCKAGLNVVRMGGAGPFFLYPAKAPRIIPVKIRRTCVTGEIVHITLPALRIRVPAPAQKALRPRSNRQPFIGDGGVPVWIGLTDTNRAPRDFNLEPALIGLLS